MLDIIKAVSKTVIGNILTLVFNAVTTKLIALFTGTAGIGLWGISKQFFDTVIVICTLNGGVSVVRGISKNRETKEEFIATVAIIYFVSSFVILTLIYLFSEMLSNNLRVPLWALQIMLSLIVVGIIRSLLNSILNGCGAIGSLASIQVLSAFIGCLVALPVLYFSEGTTSAILMIMGMIVLSSVTSAFIIIKRKKLLNGVKFRYSLLQGSIFFSTAGAMLITGIVGVACLFGIKALISKYYGLSELGLFEAAWTIGKVYILIILSAFGTYYLPKLSSIEKGKQADLVNMVFRLSIFMFLPLILSFILFKQLVIHILYSSLFNEAADLLQWLLLSDYLKITVWVFSILLIANANYKVFVVNSILWDVGVLVSVFYVSYLGEKISFIGPAILSLYIAQLCLVYLYSSNVLKVSITKNNIFMWLYGLVVVCIISLLSWGGCGVNILSALFAAFFLFLMFFIFTTSGEKKIVVNYIKKIRGR